MPAHLHHTIHALWIRYCGEYYIWHIVIETIDQPQSSGSDAQRNNTMEQWMNYGCHQIKVLHPNRLLSLSRSNTEIWNICLSFSFTNYFIYYYSIWKIMRTTASLKARWRSNVLNPLLIQRLNWNGWQCQICGIS